MKACAKTLLFHYYLTATENAPHNTETPQYPKFCLHQALPAQNPAGKCCRRQLQSCFQAYYPQRHVGRMHFSHKLSS